MYASIVEEQIKEKIKNITSHTAYKTFYLDSC